MNRIDGIKNKTPSPVKIKKEPGEGKEKKPRKQEIPKEKCKFCGNEYADIQKHEKKCKENPENQKPSIDIEKELGNFKESIRALVTEQVDARIPASFKSEIDGRFLAIERLVNARNEELNNQIIYLKDGISEFESKNSIVASGIMDIDSEWKKLRSAVLKRWKESPGYLIAFKNFEEKIEKMVKHFNP